MIKFHRFFFIQKFQKNERAHCPMCVCVCVCVHAYTDLSHARRTDQKVEIRSVLRRYVSAENKIRPRASQGCRPTNVGGISHSQHEYFLHAIEGAIHKVFGCIT